MIRVVDILLFLGSILENYMIYCIYRGKDRVIRLLWDDGDSRVNK